MQDSRIDDHWNVDGSGDLIVGQVRGETDKSSKRPPDYACPRVFRIEKNLTMFEN